MKALPVDPEDPDRIPGAAVFYQLMAEHPDAWPKNRLVDVRDYLDRTFTKTPLIVMADRAGLHTRDSDAAWEIVDQLTGVPPHRLFSPFHETYSEQRHKKDTASRISRSGEGRG